jgi:hypothetical protein
MEIERTRAEHRRLSEQIVEGDQYSEPVTVTGIDNKEHQVDIYVVNDEDFRACLHETNLSDMSGKGLQENALKGMDFLAALAKKATRDPELTKFTDSNGVATIANKALQLRTIPKPSSDSSADSTQES